MTKISINPNFPLINKYFNSKSSFSTEDQLKEEAKWFENLPLIIQRWLMDDLNGMEEDPDYEFFHKLSEQKAVRRRKKVEDAKNIELDIDILKYSELLRSYGLESYHDEMLYVSFQLKRHVPIFLKMPIEHNQIKKSSLEKYEALKYFLINGPNFSDTEIWLVNNKDKNSTVRIKQPLIVSQLMMGMRNFIANMVIEYDLSEDRFWSVDDFSVEVLENRIAQSKGKQGRPRGLSALLADFANKFVCFLTNETPLKADTGIRISDKQGTFIFELLSLLDLIEPDSNRAYRPSDYIRTLISNQRPKVRRAAPKK